MAARAVGVLSRLLRALPSRDHPGTLEPVNPLARSSRHNANGAALGNKDQANGCNSARTSRAVASWNENAGPRLQRQRVEIRSRKLMKSRPWNRPYASHSRQAPILQACRCSLLPNVVRRGTEGSNRGTSCLLLLVQGTKLVDEADRRIELREVGVETRA